ncbi:MAG: hypothetical protein PVH61_17545 [Candidatus Aminicenantes bacterium]|jgi:hypothetical protein
MMRSSLARRRMKIMLSISQFYCRGLIYQALTQAIHPLGLMNQTVKHLRSNLCLFFLRAPSRVFVVYIHSTSHEF